MIEKLSVASVTEKKLSAKGLTGTAARNAGRGRLQNRRKFLRRFHHYPYDGINRIRFQGLRLRPLSALHTKHPQWINNAVSNRIASDLSRQISSARDGDRRAIHSPACQERGCHLKRFPGRPRIFVIKMTLLFDNPENFIVISFHAPQHRQIGKGADLPHGQR